MIEQHTNNQNTMDDTARFVLDTSVIVKWLNRDREAYTEEAEDILKNAFDRTCSLFISDLTLHEVFNALIRGKRLQGTALQQAVETFWLFPFTVVQTDQQLASIAALIAEQDSITFYDAIYCAIAFDYSIPLITANPKHQRSRQGVVAVPLDTWFAFRQL